MGFESAEDRSRPAAKLTEEKGRNMTDDSRKLVEVDSRRRIHLGDMGKHHRYLAHTEPDGTIILTPAVVVPASTIEEKK